MPRLPFASIMGKVIGECALLAARPAFCQPPARGCVSGVRQVRPGSRRLSKEKGEAVRLELNPSQTSSEVQQISCQ